MRDPIDVKPSEKVGGDDKEGGDEYKGNGSEGSGSDFWLLMAEEGLKGERTNNGAS